MVYKYKVENLMFNELKKSAVVPKFQRKLVWSKNEKKSFIDTLSKGYPFGSILIYKYEEDSKYSIIDGLQRFTTIEDYIKNPEKYISFGEIVSFILETFTEIESIAYTTLENYKSKLNIAIELFIKESINGDDSTNAFYSNLKELVPEIFQNLKMEEYIKLEKITKELLNKVKNHLNVESLPIPTIIFTGEVEELAAVFENLNRGGKKLSKYQVFAAQWSKHEIKLSENIINNRILEITIKRYEDLIESRNVEINNFSRDEMLENKTINIAELCYALGYLILEKMLVFWDKDNDDVANQIGYSTLALVFGIKNKDMNTLVKYFDKLDNADFIEEFVTQIINIFRDINDRFAKIFKVPGIDNNKFYGGSTASDFQLLSFFGSLWGTKYENLQNGKLQIKPKYKVNYNIIEKNLVKYFTYDTVLGRWTGTGDTRLDRIVLEGQNYYLKELDRDRFNQALFNWHEDVIAKNSINFEPVSKMLYTVLSSFYLQKYDENKYDSEHVISRKDINDIKKESNKAIPGGSIGNHMYLDTVNNRSKKEFSLYDVKKAGFELKEDFLKYQSYPSKQEFGDIKYEIERKNGDYDQIIQTITKRGEYLINDLVNKIYE